MTAGLGRRFFMMVAVRPIVSRPLLRRLFPLLARYWLTRRLARIAQFMISRRQYFTNVQHASAYGPLTAIRRGLPSFMRLAPVWDGLAETARRGTAPAWLADLEVSGLQRLVELHRAGTPVILVVPHIGLSGLMLTQLFTQHGITFTTTGLGADFIAGIGNVPSVDADTPVESFHVLRRGNVLVHAGDAPAPGLPCSFLGEYVSFPTMVARLAARTGAVIATAYCHETTPGKWRAVIDEPMGVQDQSPEEITRRLVRQLEQIVRAHPFEWVLPLFHPFLTSVSFPRTGVLPIMIAFATSEQPEVRNRYMSYQHSYAGIEMQGIEANGLDLVAVLAHLQNERSELLLLVNSALGAKPSDVPEALLWFFRLDTDIVGYEPSDQLAQRPDVERSLTTYSVAVVKTAVVRRLVADGVRRLDSQALRTAKQLGFRAYDIPSAEQLEVTERQLDFVLKRSRLD